MVIFSVTTENCSTSPVFSSVLDRRIDRTNPPNYAPITSRGMPLPSMLSTAMPSRPMRLTASVPSTRSRIAWSACLNATPLPPLLHLLQPALEFHDLRIQLRPSRQRIEFQTDLTVLRIPLENFQIDLAGLFTKSL